MFCNTEAFKSSCVDISVDLGFPEFSYCAQPNFTTPNQPGLHTPGNVPSPDVANIEVACIDIMATGTVTFAAPRVVMANALNSPLVNRASFGVASSASGCASGLYRLAVHIEVPCVLDGIPDSIPVKVAGVEAGKIEFLRGSVCSAISVRANLNSTVSAHRLHILDMGDPMCLLDEDISGEVIREDRDNIDLIIEKSGCKIRKLILKVPVICMLADGFDTPAHIDGSPVRMNSTEVLKVWFNNPRSTAKFLYPSLPVVGITSPHFKISYSGNKVWISGYLASRVGATGPTGERGDPGDIEFVVVNLQGYTGMHGARGMQGYTGSRGLDAESCGDMDGYTGPTGITGVCHDVDKLTCPCPHSCMWSSFTGILTIDSCQILGNALRIQYKRAEWKLIQDVNGLAVEMNVYAGQTDIPGQDPYRGCE